MARCVFYSRSTAPVRHTIWNCFYLLCLKILFAARRQQSKMLLILVIAAYLTIYCVALVSPQSNSWSAHSPKPPEDLLRLWIDRQQVKMFSGKETRKKHFIYLCTPLSRARIVLPQPLYMPIISAHNLLFPSLRTAEIEVLLHTHVCALSLYWIALPKLFQIYFHAPLFFKLEFSFCQHAGFSMDIYAIRDELISPYILDPKFEEHLPIIPAEVFFLIY